MKYLDLQRAQRLWSAVTARLGQYVPASRTVNGKALSANISLTASDVGAPPSSHAATATTYGVGSASNYGHVKASNASPLAAGTAAVGADDGTYARGTHIHPAQSVPSASSTTPKSPGTAAVGSETAYARGDHVHPSQSVPAASSVTPSAPGTAAVGASSAYARADHVHPSQSVPSASSVTPSAPGTAAVGTSSAYARADHVHASQSVPAASSTTPKSPGTAAAGSEAAYARGDHVHPSQSVPSASSTTPKSPGTAAVGSETAYARGDHVHAEQTSITGNAATATRLYSGQAISTDPTSTYGASFNGTAGAVIGIAPNLTDGAAANTLPIAGVATALTPLLNTTRNCLKWLVARFDSSGNANTALKLSTARTIALTGAVIGSANFDGSASVSIATTQTASTGEVAFNLSVGAGGTMVLTPPSGFTGNMSVQLTLANSATLAQANAYREAQPRVTSSSTDGTTFTYVCDGTAPTAAIPMLAIFSKSL